MLNDTLAAWCADHASHFSWITSVPMPGAESSVGGHALVAVGYNDTTQRFVIRNSWGPGKGDQGYYYMPYQYLTTGTLADDFWTVRTVTTAALHAPQ